MERQRATTSTGKTTLFHTTTHSTPHTTTTCLRKSRRDVGMCVYREKGERLTGVLTSLWRAVRPATPTSSSCRPQEAWQAVLSESLRGWRDYCLPPHASTGREQALYPRASGRHPTRTQGQVPPGHTGTKKGSSCCTDNFSLMLTDTVNPREEPPLDRHSLHREAAPSLPQRTGSYAGASKAAAAVVSVTSKPHG